MERAVGYKDLRCSNGVFEMRFANSRAGIGFICVATAALATGCCPRPPEGLNVLMITGGQEPSQQVHLSDLVARLTGRGEMSVDVAHDLSSLADARTIGRYRVLLFNSTQQETLGAAARRNILQHVTSGGGLVSVHGALGSFRDWPEWSRMIGGLVAGRGTYGPIECVTLDPAHPAMLSIGRRLTITDELCLVDCDPDVEVLIRTANVHKDAQDQVGPTPEPQAWAQPWGSGRVFAIAFGHTDSLNNEQFIALLHNGLRWAGRAAPETPHNQLALSEQQEGFALLFNGRDLAGWTGDTRHWSVEDGELTGRASHLETDSFLESTGTFGDFELRFSVRLTGGKGNSGLIFRASRGADGVLKGYEADVAPNRYGTLYEEGGTRGVLVEGFKGIGEHVAVVDGWNDMAVRALGSKITLSVNGVTTAEYEEPDVAAHAARGRLAMELHRHMGMEVRFRDIRIRPSGR